MESNGDRRGGAGGELIVAPKVIADIVGHVSSRLPFESGGIVLGETADEVLIGETFVSLPTLLPSATRYHAAAADTVRLIMRADKAGKQVVATVHSHPSNSSTPSQRDLSYAYAHEKCAHLVVTFPRGRAELHAYVYRRGEHGDVEYLAIPLHPTLS